MRITSGGNIVFGKVSSSLSNLEVDVDHISIYPGLADACSALFGGSPISVVISSTAMHCVRLSEVLMMGIMTAMLLAGQLLGSMGINVLSAIMEGMVTFF